MRRIRLTPLDDPAWHQWTRSCDAETEKFLAALTRGDSLRINEKLYRQRKIRDLYFFSGGPPFYGKCAYCERALELIDGDIDHFRPKCEVCDEGGCPIFIFVQGEAPRKHPGYYWLIYDWTNLLPCCRSCNRHYKGARFPVEGKHAMSAAEVPFERPLLINPASEQSEDDPEHHLSVKRDGSIGGKTYRGAATVRILGLNRDSLRKGRGRAYYAAVGIWIRLHNSEPAERDDALRRLRRIREGHEPYYLAQQAALAEMEAKAGS